MTISSGQNQPSSQPQVGVATAPAAAPSFTPRPTPGYRTRYIAHNTPTTMIAAQTLTITLTLQNAGSFIWTQGGPKPFRLGFQWYNAAGQMLQLPPELDFRTPLPQDVQPNTLVTLQARLRTPDTPGIYQLRWDMVHELVTWFVTQGDAGLLVSPITITPVVTVATTPAPVVTPAPAAPSAAPGPAQIQDISNQLARHAVKRYAQRQPNTIRRIIIHHTGTPPNITPQRIAQFQVDRKDLAGITYHFCLTPEGTAYQTQSIALVAAHAGQDSQDSVGVCLIGDFTNAPPPQPQLEATASVLAQLLNQLKIGLDQIFGYSQIANTQSPGATWPTWKDSLLSRVRDLVSAPTAKPAAVVEKPIEHYLLLWHRGSGNWAEWDLRGALDYIGQFPVTIGFSVEEAKLAKNVTILGGPGGIPDTVDQLLQAAGCKVDRLAGATESETRKLLNDLVKQGQRFRNLR